MSKVVIVTGGSRGIGAATARLFANHGFAICINYKTNDKAAAQLSEELTASNTPCITVKSDVSTEEGALALFKATDEAFGRLDVLVNNAGILKAQSKVIDMCADRIDAILKNNVTGYFLCSREAIKRMSKSRAGHGGVIVNVSSGAAKSGSPNEYIDYAASKGAIDTLTKGLSVEVAPEGIRVNCVRPGFILTDMHTDGGDPNRVERLKSKIPLGRGGTAEEVAKAIYWSACDDSSFSTGNFIDVSGGL
jgi:NAD(P)-dependent dehydrogenase (short-subunit alcohol dehydrogenase family)